MNATTTAKATTYNFGDEITITNNYGQTGHATVIRQDGETLTVDYLGGMHKYHVSRVVR